MPKSVQILTVVALVVSFFAGEYRGNALGLHAGEWAGVQLAALALMARMDTYDLRLPVDARP